MRLIIIDGDVCLSLLNGFGDKAINLAILTAYKIAVAKRTLNVFNPDDALLWLQNQPVFSDRHPS
jgi:hypothetical protein